MSFSAAVEHLDSLGLELAPTSLRRKFDLEHMRILARALGNPQLRVPSVLIAGTNGKGSTAATLAHILSAAGYRTGLYTSPHLTRVTERIRTAGPQSPFTEIPEAEFARLYFQVDDAARTLVFSGELPHPPSFFETLTALAFLHFAERNLDIAILEVGLGGRLDATNIVEPLLSVITDIALDHQEYLGNTLAAIAREKAGILRENGLLITLPQHPEASQAIGEAAIALNVHAISAAPYLPNRDDIARDFSPGTIATNRAGALVPATFTEDSLKHPHISAASLASATCFPPNSPAPFSAASDGQPEIKRAIGPATYQPGPQAQVHDCLEIERAESPIHDPPAHIRGIGANHYTITLDGGPLIIHSPLPGQHQRRNIALAIASATTLRNLNDYKLSECTPTRNIKSYNITNPSILRGIAATEWPGRLEFLPPSLLLDVAHNPAGAWALRAAIATLPEQQPRTLIFSCLRDKDLAEMAQILFPLFDSTGDRPRDHIVLAPIDNPRAASLADLEAAARTLDTPAHIAQNPAEALALARSLTPAGGVILATGSVYLVGTLRQLAIGTIEPSQTQ